MALVAQTQLLYSDGDKSVTVEEGQVVKEGVFPKKVLERFKEIGSVTEPPASPAESAAAEENEELKRQVKELEAELAAAKKSSASTPPAGDKK